MDLLPKEIYWSICDGVNLLVHSLKILHVSSFSQNLVPFFPMIPEMFHVIVDIVSK